MHEPAITLTDYGLTIECWAFAILIARSKPKTLGLFWQAFFIFVGTASLLGGTVHGFFPDDASLPHKILWRGNMIALGLTAVCVWNIGALLTERPFIMHRLPQLALGLLAGYVGTILFVSDRFVVGIAMYLPSAVFLLVAMSMAHVRDSKRGWAIGIVGLALTFVAAAVQQLKVALHPVWFDHNAFFHLIQAIALFLLFRAQSRVSATA